IQKSISNMLEAGYDAPRTREITPSRRVEHVRNEAPPLRDSTQNARDVVRPSQEHIRQVRNEVPNLTAEIHNYEDAVPQVAVSGQHDNEVSISKTTVAKKVRGPNICKTVAELQPGEKLPVTFHWNRAAGSNHKAFSRYIGKIVRNNQVCPARIKEWSDLTDAHKDHMWAATKDKFDHPEMEFYKEEVFLHMRDLWIKWRSDLHIKYVRNSPKSLEEVLKVVPPNLNKEDWEWCVTEVFLSDEYKGIANGGKDDQADVFFRTYATKNEIKNLVAKEKHSKMKKIIEENPNWTELEVAEATFGPQNKGHVTGFGGGVRPKDLKGSSFTSKAELATKLRQSEVQNSLLQDSVTTLQTTIADQASMMTQIMEDIRALKEKGSNNGH
ncbi:hypothetical protein LINPERHAP2_LOCUS7046, partial [Linum perenne]